MNGYEPTINEEKITDRVNEQIGKFLGDGSLYNIVDFRKCFSEYYHLGLITEDVFNSLYYYYGYSEDEIESTIKKHPKNIPEAMEAFALRTLNDGTAEELAILPEIIRLYLDCTKNEKQSNSIAVISDSIKHKKF